MTEEVKTESIIAESKNGSLKVEIKADVTTSIAILTVIAKEIADKAGLTPEAVLDIAKEPFKAKIV